MTPRIAIPIPTASDTGYNARSLPQYTRAITLAGGEPVPIPLHQSPAETARLIASCTGVLLPGSPADVNPQKYGQDLHPAAAPPDPARENVDELLLQDAHNMGKPLLAICFGIQILNVWRGGSLIQDIRSALPGTPVDHQPGRTIVEAHAIDVAPSSLLASLLAESAHPSSQLPTHNSQPPLHATVNSSHHQAIAAPGDNLAITARSSADGIIEALEGGHGAAAWDRSFLLGVQWHPERTYDESPLSRAIFHAFIQAAATWTPRPVSTSIA